MNEQANRQTNEQKYELGTKITPCAIIYIGGTSPSNLIIDSSMTNRQAWKAAQNQSNCYKAAISHLWLGKVPSNKKGDAHNKILHYVWHGTLVSDRLLVTLRDKSTYAPGDHKTKIIVPHHLAAGLLYHLHNNVKFAEHPSMSQLKQIFNRNFHTENLSPLLEELYKKIYLCTISQKQPKIVTSNLSITQAGHPYRQFHANVLRQENNLSS